MHNIVLEWESIQFPLRLSSVTSEFGYYQIPEDATLEIKRDNNYQLKAELFGTTDDFSIPENFEYKNKQKKTLLGSFLEDENFKAIGIEDKREYSMRGCHLGSWHSSSDRSYSVSVYVQKLVESCYPEEQATKVVDWFLCGRINTQFPRTTRREGDKKKRVPFDEAEDVRPTFQRGIGYSSSRDYYLIQTNNLKFAVQIVNRKDGYLPLWSHGLAIEYRENWGGIPNDNIREAIREIIGFLFGTELLKIGTSEYDSKDRIIRRIALATKEGTVARCKAQAVPPLKFEKVKSIENEPVLNELVTSYLYQWKDLKLSDVLWKYWIAKFLPVGTNLPILSSALENLCEAYIKKNKLITKYSREEKRGYRKLIAEDLEKLNEKLTPYDFKKRTLDKLENPFNVGVGEKINLFFNTLGFDFTSSSIEREALKARNTMTHESLSGGTENDKRYIRLSNAYRTLVNRTILKVLGYSGNYIDYYTVGHPERCVSENIQGNK